MATPASANAEIGAELQKAAMLEMQGKKVTRTGELVDINVSQEQSQKVQKGLTILANDLLRKKPENLQVEDQQILALFQSIQEKGGQLDGKEACQAMVLLEISLRKKEYNTPTNKENRTKAETVRVAARTLASEVLPAEADGVWSKVNRWSANQEGWLARAMLGSDQVQDSLRAENTYVNIFDNKLEAITGGHRATREQYNQAVNETITQLGDNKVDSLLEEVEARKAEELRSGQRREAHLRQEEIKESLEKRKPQYQENINKDIKLKEKDAQLRADMRLIDDKIDDLFMELGELGPALDPAEIDTLRQEVKNLSLVSVGAEAELQRLQAELKILTTAYKEAQEGKVATLDVNPLRDTIDNYAQQQAAAYGEAGGHKAKADTYQREYDLVKGKNDARTQELTNLIAAERQLQAQKEAEAKGYDERKRVASDKIDDMSKKKDKLTPADLKAIHDQERAIQQQITDKKNEKAFTDQELAEAKNKLQDAEKDDKTRKDKTREVDKMQVAKDRKRTSIVENNDEMWDNGNNIYTYEADQRELAGVEKTIAALDKAEDQAKKMVEGKKTKAADIQTTFGFNETSLPSDTIRAAVERVTGQKMADVPSAERAMAKMNSFNFWRLLMEVFGGAEVA